MLRGLKFATQFRKFNFIKSTQRNIAGFYQTIVPDTSTIEKGQKIDVYEGPEWEEINNHLTKSNYFEIVPHKNDKVQKLQDIWEDCVFSTKFKPKYFSLLPFHMEDRNSLYQRKKFVLKMELYPDTKILRFTCAMISGSNNHNYRCTFVRRTS
jgi:hypothetical protein